MRVRKTRNSTNITPQLWNEAGFRDLTHTAQWLFLTIGTLPELDWSGCLNYNPHKLAALNTNLTPEGIETAAQELHKHGWVLLDPGTQEIYLRGYQTMGTHLRHANMGKALAAALDTVYSRDIRHEIIAELHALQAKETYNAALKIPEIQQLITGYLQEKGQNTTQQAR